MKFTLVSSFLLLSCLLSVHAQPLPKVEPVLHNPVDSNISAQGNGVARQLDTAVSHSTEHVGASPITVKGFNIVGASLFTADIMQALVADVASGSYQLTDMQAAAGRITHHYRNEGYFLARAYLPAQKMDEGVVTIAVLEGKLAEVQLENTSRLADAVLKARLADLIPGAVLHRSTVDRALLLVGDVPGVGSVDSRLTAGPKSGETILVVVVKPAPAWTGKVEADNFGSLYSGVNRIGASIEGNSPLGYGERVSANLLASNENMVYGRAGLQVPFGARGMTVGAGLNHSQYSLADTYKALDALGQSDAVEATLRYPLVRTVQFNVYGQANVERRKLRDEVRSTSTLTDKDASVVSLALQADWRDSMGGLTANSQASITVTSGRLNIASASAAAIDATAANTAGGYGKVTINASRQQGLTDKLSMAAQLRGQWANKNLDSSEKFSLGGASCVRAYPSGEASGDKGWMGSLEIRYAVLQNLAASLFYETGSINVNANPFLTTSNERSLSGSGIGLAGNYDAFDWRFTLAWRNGDPSTSEPDKSPRFWAQAGWRF